MNFSTIFCPQKIIFIFDSTQTPYDLHGLQLLVF